MEGGGGKRNPNAPHPPHPFPPTLPDKRKKEERISHNQIKRSSRRQGESHFPSYMHPDRVGKEEKKKNWDPFSPPWGGRGPEERAASTPPFPPGERGEDGASRPLYLSRGRRGDQRERRTLSFPSFLVKGGRAASSYSISGGGGGGEYALSIFLLLGGGGSNVSHVLVITC